MGDAHLTDFLQWTPDAEAKLKNVPYFVRAQARHRVEQLARKVALEIVTAELVEKARIEFGQ
ncbi:MAG TPA: PCP reductase family protein [Candidatus Caenarcaniphilales bacterium]